MATLALSNSDRVALIDDADQDLMREYTWFLNRRGNGKVYVTAQTWPNGRQYTLRLHRHILGLSPGDGLLGDHINGDTLDNRRTNLRVVTPQQHPQNVRVVGGASRFRGVIRKKKKWQAQAKINGKLHYLGRFDDEVDAARAADDFRLQHMPFATPDPTLQDIEVASAPPLATSSPVPHER